METITPTTELPNDSSKDGFAAIDTANAVADAINKISESIASSLSRRHDSIDTANKANEAIIKAADHSAFLLSIFALSLLFLTAVLFAAVALWFGKFDFVAQLATLVIGVLSGVLGSSAVTRRSLSKS